MKCSSNRSSVLKSFSELRLILPVNLKFYLLGWKIERFIDEKHTNYGLETETLYDIMEM